MLLSYWFFQKSWIVNFPELFNDDFPVFNWWHFSRFFDLWHFLELLRFFFQSCLFLIFSDCFMNVVFLQSKISIDDFSRDIFGWYSKSCYLMTLQELLFDDMPRVVICWYSKRCYLMTCQKLLFADIPSVVIWWLFKSCYLMTFQELLFDDIPRVVIWWLLYAKCLPLIMRTVLLSAPGIMLMCMTSSGHCSSSGEVWKRNIMAHLEPSVYTEKSPWQRCSTNIFMTAMTWMATDDKYTS